MRDGNGVIPDWLTAAARGHMKVTSGLPAPILFTTWTEHVDWFDLQYLHPVARDSAKSLTDLAGASQFRCDTRPENKSDDVDGFLERHGGDVPACRQTATTLLWAQCGQTAIDRTESPFSLENVGEKGLISRWRVRDSNPRRLRRLIYSQIPLAAWVTRQCTPDQAHSHLIGGAGQEYSSHAPTGNLFDPQSMTPNYDGAHGRFLI